MAMVANDEDFKWIEVKSFKIHAEEEEEREGKGWDISFSPEWTTSTSTGCKTVKNKYATNTSWVVGHTVMGIPGVGTEVWTQWESSHLCTRLLRIVFIIMKKDNIQLGYWLFQETKEVYYLWIKFPFK